MKVGVLIATVLLVACGGSTPHGTSGGGPSGPDTVSQGHDWSRFGWDVGRSGVSTAPTGITAGNVGSMQRQQVQLPGTVDASAIYLSDVQIGGASHDAFFVTTTYGKTVAVGAHTGVLLWTYTPPGYDGWSGSAQITTATPVADPGRAYIYAASPDGHIQKLAVADGHAVWSTAITLAPSSEKVASSLNYFAGRVIAVTGGYVGDAPTYQGHVAVLDAASGQIVHVYNSLCSDQRTLIVPSSCDESGSAIWGRAGAVIDSTTGDIYIATGNGRWDGHTYWGDATLRLDSTATQRLGNYTPANTKSLDQGDLDLGSTSPVLLGGGAVVQGGKDGTLRVLTAAEMAGATAHLDGEAQQVSTPGGAELLTAPALYRTGGGTSLFVANDQGTAAWSLNSGQLTTLWENGHPGTSPVVAGGLLFIYDARGGGLRVYQPASGTLIATLPCGGGHWNSPIIADGRIALPEGSANSHSTTGVLDIWRLK